MFKKLKDDSIEKINYYQNILKDSASPILKIVIEIMNAWSKIVKTGRFDFNDRNIFKNAICKSHEYIWFEAGQKLIQLMQHDKTAKEIFIEVFNDKNWKPRFNVVALSKNFDKKLAEFILTKGIDDKSSKVREKVANVILSREDKHLLPLLEKHLKNETNEKVRNAINFTFDHIHNLKRDKEGSIIFTVGDDK